MKEIMKELGMEDTKENRKALDKRIRASYKLEDMKCQEVWREIKPMIKDSTKKEELIDTLKKI